MRSSEGGMKNIGIDWLFPCSLATLLLTQHSGAQQWKQESNSINAAV